MGTSLLFVMPTDTYRRYVFMNAFGEEPRPEVMAGSFPLDVGTIAADGTFTVDEDGGPIMKVEMAMESINMNVDVDIGANASADGQDDGEGADDAGSIKALNVVHHQQLQDCPLDKKGFQAVFKGYMKQIMARLKDQGKDDAKFKAGAMGLMKYIVGSFDDWGFYMDCNQDMTTGIFACKGEGADGDKPTLYLMMDGL